MCAIAGVVCTQQECRSLEHGPQVRRMCGVQAHRGPDDEGISEHGPVCFGSRRLMIIDLSQAAHMPMSDPTGRWWIVYNGETYNFQSLREQLRACGHEFVSTSDTEVVLHAFAQWGEGCLDRFVGMFAFAILDRDTNTVTLARDRFGKKPLYYIRREAHLYFASEVKALLEVCDNLAPNYQRLIEWSLYRNPDFGSPDTLFDGLSLLPPGHVLTIRDGQPGPPRRYYSPESDVDAELYKRLQRQPAAAVTGQIDELLQESVRARLVSDVPLGTLCSGGIDSSLITALCARHMPDVAAFHVSVTGYEHLDESQYARQVADQLAITLHTYPLSAQAFRDNLVRAIYHSDFPLTHSNSVAFLLISEFARARGVTILLSGEAADELFGGYMQRYRRYRQFLWAQRLLALLPAKARKAFALAGYASEQIPVTSFSEYPGLLAHATGFLDKFARQGLRLRCEDAYGFVNDRADRAVLAAMLADLTNFLTPLLRRLDRMSMAASIECRTPFLDRELVRLAVNLPLAYRLRGRTDKWVLKEVAARYLPRSVVHRRKRGFPLPIRDYLAPLARPDFFIDGFCIDVLGMHRAGLLDAVAAWDQNVDGFFNLLALEIWGRLFFLRQSRDAVNDQIGRLSRRAA
jgi:asparagine synthase (glutamine-hydrolysing)